MRIVLLHDYVKKNFPASPILDYAFEVEKITTKKKPNLILNVDGFIACSSWTSSARRAALPAKKLTSMSRLASSTASSSSDAAWASLVRTKNILTSGKEKSQKQSSV